MNTLILPCFNLVAIDNTTYYCKELQQKCGRIFDIYLYDSRLVTHICEFTGSYELEYLETKTEFMTNGQLEMEFLLLNASEDLLYQNYACYQIDNLNNQVFFDLEKDFQDKYLFLEGVLSYKELCGQIMEEYHANGVTDDIFPREVLSSYYSHFFYQGYDDKENDYSYIEIIHPPELIEPKKLYGEKSKTLWKAIAQLDQSWSDRNWESSPDAKFKTYREHLDFVLKYHAA